MSVDQFAVQPASNVTNCSRENFLGNYHTTCSFAVDDNTVRQQYFANTRLQQNSYNWTLNKKD